MSIKIILLPILLLCFTQLNAQRQVVTTSSGEISFFSSAPLEDIKAINNQVRVVLDTETGEIMVRLAIKHFEFDKSLMQKHFNENYMESDEYPEAEFLGKITNFNVESLSPEATFSLEGRLTIKDTTHSIKAEATIKKEGENLICRAEFPVKVEDYNVDVPRLMMRNIAEVVDVTVKFTLK